MLTESQAWGKMGIAFYEESGMPFICHHLDSLRGNDLISQKLYEKTEKTIMGDVKLFNHPITWNHFALKDEDGNAISVDKPEARILRADYCILQQCIAETGGI